MISYLYNLVFYRPLLNALVWLTSVLPGQDIGMAVILLTLIVRFVVLPFTHKAAVAQKKMKEIEPELKQIKEKHKGNQQEQAKQTMELYRLHGISPFSGFVTLLVQIPVIIALYKVFLGGFDFKGLNLYSFVSVPGNINKYFLGFLDMTKPNHFMAALAAVSHFYLIKFTVPPSQAKNTDKKTGKGDFKADFAKSMNFQLKYIMPIFIFMIADKLSSAISLYWTTTNVFAIVHGIIVGKEAMKIRKKQAYDATNGNNQKNFGEFSG